jgi:CspA family cold shock protein
MTETVTENTTSVTGRVKWFNSKSGFGFITITEGDNAGNDIFVHHTSLNVTNDQYRYLLEGEYVELDISTIASGKHSMQSANVKGIKGGKLMCETRYDCRLLKNAYREEKNNADETDINVIVPKQRQAPKEVQPTQKQTKKVIQTNSAEWNVVEKKKRTNNKKVQK